MREFTIILIYSFFSVFLLSAVTHAQNSLTHNTGTLEVTIIESGYIGDDGTGTYGGVVFNGNPNAMWTGGYLIGDNGEAYGNIASYIIEDFNNLIPISGFYSNGYFNEIAHHSLYFNLNPDSKADITSLSNTGHNFVFISADIYNNVSAMTDIYPGIFADWDVGNYISDRGGYDPSRNLFYMYENGGATDSNYYGIVGVNMAPNSIRGTIISNFTWSRTEAFVHMTSTAFDTITTDADYRMFISFGPFTAPAGTTITLDVAIVAGTSLADLQANADAAIVYGQNIPVELTSFTATSLMGKVYLNWSTATEINNKGFEVERKILNEENYGEWMPIGFREGHGTTAEPQEYFYVDDISNITAASLLYRLKQIDFNGTYEYSDEVLVDNPTTLDYSLQQNFPNPFNPSTKIRYTIPQSSNVVIKVFDILGNEIETLVNEEKPAGTNELTWNAVNLPSGVYFYQLRAGDFIQTKQMILLK